MVREESKPDIDGLKIFASPILTKDRGWSPFFSGRHQEIENVELGVEGVMTRFQSGERMPASDETWLFQGPPGVGKSALLAKLGERWNVKKSDAAPIAVPIRADHVFSQANLVAKIADALAISNNDAEASDKLEQIVSIDHGSTISADTEFSEGQSVVRNSRELTWETLTSLFPRKNWKRPVVLLLDEAQSLSRWEGPSEISNLHQGIHSLPIIPIFAGLSDSFEVLRDHDISRMAHRRRVTLWALEQSEAEEAVKSMLDAFRVGGSNHEDWMHRITEESGGWPQHLQTGMQALAKVVAENHGMLGPLEGDFADAVSEISARYRNESYEGRFDDDLAGCFGLLHAVLDAARPPGKSLATLKGIISSHANDSKEDEYQLPEMLDASMLLNRMIKRGFLQLSMPGRRYICPIPSLTDYINGLVGN